ncbi:MAG: HEAT repeat domain-containing protein [Planctomycetota bacterium]
MLRFPLVSVPLTLALLSGLASAQEPRETDDAARRMHTVAPEQVLADARSGNAHVRRAAVLELARRRLPEGVAVLRERLEDGDAGVRAGAAEGLGRLRDKASAHPLAALLRDGSAAVRLEAASALRLLAVDDSEVTKALLAALGDEDERVRAQVVGALGACKQDPKVPGVLDQRFERDESLGVARASIDALRRLGRAQSTRTKLVAIVEGTSAPDLRSRATVCLGELGPEAVPDLWLRLDDAQLGPSARQGLAMTELGRLLLDLRGARSSLIVGDRFRRLSDMDITPATLPLGDLVRARDVSSAVRRGAARLLGTRRSRALAAAPDLGAAIADREVADVADEAIDALAEIGPDGVLAALPGLLLALEQVPEPTELKIVQLLAKTGPRLGNRGLEALATALQWGGDETRAVAAEAIGQWGAKAKPVLQVLADCVQQDTATTVRIAVAEALGKMGKSAAPAKAALRSALHGQSDNLLQIAVSRALVAIGLAPQSDSPR